MPLFGVTYVETEYLATANGPFLSCTIEGPRVLSKYIYLTLQSTIPIS